MRHLLLSLLLLLFCTAVHGAELILHGPSYHFERDKGYNNANYGLGYKFDNLLVIGAYHNSNERVSTYAGYHFSFNEHVGVVLGVVTGYQKHDIWPAAVITFTAPIGNRWNLHFNVIPVREGFINLAIGLRM